MHSHRHTYATIDSRFFSAAAEAEDNLRAERSDLRRKTNIRHRHHRRIGRIWT